MAHEIFIDNGRASMMYAGEAPWHGLGKPVPENVTAAEALSFANLDWRVTKLPLFASTGILGVPVEGKYGIVREDKIGQQDCSVYGIVGEGYTPLQNQDAFTFFDTIVKDKNAAIYHTAGALGKGERIWILAKLPDTMRVIGDDITDKYLLLSNNHDGRASVQVKFTPIRVVCQNTLSWALNDGPTIRIQHARDLQDRLKRADEMLGVINSTFNEIEETYKAMTEVKVNSEKLRAYLSHVFPDPADKDDLKAMKKAIMYRGFAEHFFDQGTGNRMPGVAGTLWAAYNGVTEFIDHRVATGKNHRAVISPSRRLNSIWFGEGSATKLRAYNVAVEQLKTSLN